MPPRAERLLVDSTTPGDIPTHGPHAPELVAGYVDGRYQTVVELRARFPHLPNVRVTTKGREPASRTAHVCDRESGDANAIDAAGWAVDQHGSKRYPVIYCNRSSWPAAVAAIRDAGLSPRRHVGWWIADWTGAPHRPRYGLIRALACQYADPKTSGGHYDLSTVYRYWPGVDPAPTPPLTRRHRRAVKSLTRAWQHRAYGLPDNDHQLVTELERAAGRLLRLKD